MYRNERTPFGFKITFGGFMSANEVKTWADEFSGQVDRMPSAFHGLIDMRDLRPLPPDAQPHLQRGQMYAKDHGMQRTAVILSSRVLTMQFKRMAKQTGIYAYERYIDASSEPDWEKKAMSWLKVGTDPDA